MPITVSIQHTGHLNKNMVPLQAWPLSARWRQICSAHLCTPPALPTPVCSLKIHNCCVIKFTFLCSCCAHHPLFHFMYIIEIMWLFCHLNSPSSYVPWAFALWSPPILQLMYRVGQNRIYTHTVYDRIFDDFPARNTVYTPYTYGSGQPYSCIYLQEVWFVWSHSLFDVYPFFMCRWFLLCAPPTPPKHVHT